MEEIQGMLDDKNTVDAVQDDFDEFFDEPENNTNFGSNTSAEEVEQPNNSFDTNENIEETEEAEVYEETQAVEEQNQISKKELKKQAKLAKKAEKTEKKSINTKNDNIQENNQTIEDVKKPDMVLYVIIDKAEYGILNYFRESGLKVSSVFNDIKSAKSAVLMQSEPTRIVVIDTGTGKFTTTTMRSELIDMLGISDEQNKTTVFYSDSVIKIDTSRALGKSSKTIDWIPFKSTTVSVATILQYRENYVYDMEDADEEMEQEDKLLNFKGLNFSGNETPRHDISGFSSDAIMTHLVNSEDGVLPGFEIKL